MKYKPYDYQTFATNFVLEHPACGLILDMGLGKSVITLTALWSLLLDSFDVGKVLVVAPKRVAENTWPTELKKWEHLDGLTWSLVLGSEKDRRAALQRRAKIYIINRENVTWLVDNYRWDFDTLVIDELSSFKSSKAQRFRALKRVRPRINRVIGLTGTPQPNGLLDLWPQMYLLDMGQRLGRFVGGYRERFFLPDKRNREVIYSYKPKEGAEEKIYELISDICISMKAADYLDMPELVASRVEVQMNAKEQKLYEGFERDMVLDLKDGDLDAVNAAALSGKLVQMANGAVYGENRKVHHIHDRKLDALEDIIEAANGKPLLVAYWYKHDLERIRQRFEVRTIDTPKDIADWNEGKIPVALIHPASAGHGLNLQDGGSTIVWFGLTWSLELYQQLNARLWRQGQKHTVVIQHIVAAGTHDEDIMNALEKKDMSQTALIAAVKARIGGVT
ncbi:DEAD/DEAH box helicase [Acutalibacter intestini]|uniref:DEAD/DEAH box helicase n=1 Tax=Acutalibacter intestini TaxID=3093659 RepID=UPI002AC964AF|nr:DEAD/DEAH box helicase [Acutalibacter sp. M00204]